MAFVSNQVPAVLSQQSELPTLLNARARKQDPWNAKRAAKASSLEISIPQPDHFQAYSPYPAEDVKVQNTFIHVASPTAGFERVVQSCPSRHIGCLRDVFAGSSSGAKQVICLEDELFEDVPSTPEPLQMGTMALPPLGLLTPEKYLIPGQEIGFCSAPPMPGNPSMNWPAAAAQLGAYQQMPRPQQLGPLMPPVFQDVANTEPLPPVPLDPAPGSADLPSVGSKDHFTGECKPCAFLHVRGCDNGAMCNFCHLCDPGEKKRRQKAKKAAFKAGA
eukprot:TRINITY_DN2552_c0_g1_i1.p1 TRINITY_DN2552_c0_g1~~TRINITY_DN2552_c0_g1_i1.p1  ORF type:complete len:299 (+),score=58.66 TRINITY_DN2552_c0_g1_i1:74-898(+)